MRKILPVVAVLLAATAVAQAARFLYESQALTRAAPTASTEGMSLSEVYGLRVHVCAPEGYLLGGDGGVVAYLYHPTGGWMENPELEKDITVSGKRCQAFPDSKTAVPTTNHRVLYGTKGVVVTLPDGGAAATLPDGGALLVDVRVDGETIRN